MSGDPLAAFRGHSPDLRAEAAAADPAIPPSSAVRRKEPLYWRMLRLRHIRPNGWQRAVLVEGVLAVAVTLVLADVASAWTLLVLPLASVAVVKGHDILTGLLRHPDRMHSDPTAQDTRTAPPPRG